MCTRHTVVGEPAQSTRSQRQPVQASQGIAAPTEADAADRRHPRRPIEGDTCGHSGNRKWTDAAPLRALPVASSPSVFPPTNNQTENAELQNSAQTILVCDYTTVKSRSGQEAAFTSTRSCSKMADEAAGSTARTPAEFLKHIKGKPVVVKLNSGVDYKGEAAPSPAPPPPAAQAAQPQSHANRSRCRHARLPRRLHEHRHGADRGGCRCACVSSPGVPRWAAAHRCRPRRSPCLPACRRSMSTGS